jgi:hypothetical protein
LREIPNTQSFTQLHKELNFLQNNYLVVL